MSDNMDINLNPDQKSVHFDSLIKDKKGSDLLGQLMLSKDKLEGNDFAINCYLWAKTYYDKSDFKVAELLFLESLKYGELPKDAFSMLKAYGFLIRIASENLDNTKAEMYINCAEHAMDSLTKNMGSLNSEYFYNLGMIKTYRGLFKEANDNFTLALKKAEEEKENNIYMKTLLAIATNRYYRKDYNGALELYKKLKSIVSNRSYLIGNIYLFMGKTYEKLNAFEESLNYLSLANKTFHEKKCWNLYSYILLAKGIVYKRMGNFNQALILFELAKEGADIHSYRSFNKLVDKQISELNTDNVDIFLDRVNRKVKERTLGLIDFKHRFVLLEILFLLAQNAGKFFDKEQLTQLIWKADYNPLIHDKLIYTSVSRLRKLIEPKDNKNTKRKYIIRDQDGYAFNKEVIYRFFVEDTSSNENTIGNVDVSTLV